MAVEDNVPTFAVDPEECGSTLRRENGHVPSEPKSPIPRMRRELKAEAERLTRLISAIAETQRKSSRKVDDHVWFVLACAAADEPYPPREVAAGHIAKIGTNTREHLAGHCDEAVEMLRDAISILISAGQSLRLADALGEPIPAELHNLPPLDLARRLNRLGHTLLRGRVPGWEGG